MGFQREYIYLVYFPPEYIYLVQSTLHSVFVGLVVRVRYVRTHLLGFQHNHSPFSFAEVKPIRVAEQKSRHLTLQLILTQDQGMLVKEIKASNKHEVHPPMNFHELC